MAKSAVGGALRGLGSALVKRSDNEREDKLRSEDRAERDELLMREQAFTRAAQIRQEIFGTEQNRQERDFRSGEAQKDREHSDSQVIDIVPTDRGNDQAVTRGGGSRGLGFRSRETARSGASERNEDKFIVDEVKERYTSTDELTGEKTTDWTKVAQALRREGRPDLAARYEEGAEGEPAPVESPELDEVADRVGDVRAERDKLGTQGRQSPELDDYLDTAEGNLARTGRGRQSGAATSGEYATADDVKAAFRSGKLTREQALGILRSDFQYE